MIQSLEHHALINKEVIAKLIESAQINDEDLVGGFKLKSDLSLIEKNSKNTRLLFSKDDNVVPISHADKYRKKLKNAKVIIYESKNGHFKISKFPEIVRMIKNDVKKM